VLAAAGSAIGLGNIWKFPYITGVNGGGVFVFIYLLAVAAVGLPIMMAEIYIGRTTQRSPVGAFRSLASTGSPWVIVGWMGVAAGFIILSFYSVVAGWTLYYIWLAVTGSFAGQSPEAIAGMFGSLYGDPTLNVLCHVAFMSMTIAIVIGGIQKGLERSVRVLLPVLFLMMLVLLVRAAFSDGFQPALNFVFGTHFDKLTGRGVLEALGHAFFTLSLGMGALITYGSYLKTDDDIVATSITVAGLDTLIALMAAMVLFPIIFSAGLEPSAGPGLVFVSLPIAFAGMTGGTLWAAVFFLLLAFAALTSTISLLEVAVSYAIDELRWSRAKATLTCGLAILALGVPSALSGGDGFFGPHFASLTEPLFGAGHGKNWFDTLDFIASSVLLPLGGLGIAAFVAWHVGDKAREEGFKTGTRFGKLYWGWVVFLRYVVPVAVLAVFLNAIGVL
jgi:NSS family neurotransmitter:Na+ symporter